MVESAAEQLGIPPERVVVGGFSQGGIMALSLLLTKPALMHAGLVWHSRLLSQVVPLTAPADALRGKQLWLSHGTHDNVIPLAHAQAIAHRFHPQKPRLLRCQLHHALRHGTVAIVPLGTQAGEDDRVVRRRGRVGKACHLSAQWAWV